MEKTWNVYIMSYCKALTKPANCHVNSGSIEKNLKQNNVYVFTKHKLHIKYFDATWLKYTQQ